MISPSFWIIFNNHACVKIQEMRNERKVAKFQTRSRNPFSRNTSSSGITAFEKYFALPGRSTFIKNACHLPDRLPRASGP